MKPNSAPHDSDLVYCPVIDRCAADAGVVVCMCVCVCVCVLSLISLVCGQRGIRPQVRTCVEELHIYGLAQLHDTDKMSF